MDKKRKRKKKKRSSFISITNTNSTKQGKAEEADLERIEADEEEIEDLAREAESIPDTDSRLQEALTYFQKEVGKYPLLSPEEEKELARRKDEGDTEARDRLIFSNLRLVIATVSKVLSRMGNSSILDYMDLVQEGVMGLMIAVDRFDYKRGTRFSTYGVPWIYQQVKLAILKHRRGLEVPGYTGNSLAQMKEYIDKYNKGEQIPEDCLKRVKTLARLKMAPLPICEATTDNETETYIDLSWANITEAEEDEPLEVQIDKGMMSKQCIALLEDILSPEDLDIIKRRFGIAPYAFPSLLGDIAEAYGKSVEYMRKRVNSILNSLKWNPRFRECYKKYIVSDE